MSEHSKSWKVRAAAGSAAALLAMALTLTACDMPGASGGAAETDGSISADGSTPEGASGFSVEGSLAAAQLKEDESRGLFVLVNKLNEVDRDYEPEDLTEMTYYVADRDPTTRYMRAEAVEAFNKMHEAAEKDGIDFRMTTAYRSYAFQNVLWTQNVAAKGEAEANKTSARPGQSEHRTGLATDISCEDVNWQVTSKFKDTDAGKWVAEHAHEYGFIIRYPDGREDSTGYTYESWHLRYVNVTAATEIWERDLTLEEFLEEKGLGSRADGGKIVFD